MSVKVKLKRIHKGLKSRKSDFWICLPIILFSVFSLLSLFWVFMGSLKTNQEIYESVWAFPKQFHFENYVNVWSTINMKRYFVNSIFIVSISVIILDLICAPAAYVLGRTKFRINKYLTFLFLMGLGIPIPIILIPLYKIFISMHLIDSMQGLVLAYVVVNIPFTIFLLSAFVKSLPSELEEASVIDGCSSFGAFWRVMLPLTIPGIITVTIFNFVTIWNEYLIALVFITRAQNRPLSLGLYSINNSMIFTGNWVGLFAGTMIVALPIIIIFTLLARRIMSAMTFGAIKG